MVTVKKGNVELNVDETEVSKFLAKGYDQINAKGEVVKEATGGKTVSYEEYKKVCVELAALKKQLAEVSAEKTTEDAGKKKSEAGKKKSPEEPAAE